MSFDFTTFQSSPIGGVRWGLFLLFLATQTFGATYSVYDLRCENADGMPIGVECDRPSLSWKINSDRRGTVQQAYQIAVAETKDKVTEGTVWNSGKVENRTTVNIRYDGATLKTATRYYWAVRSWNSRGECSGWSKPQAFITAIDDNWGEAKWIALEKDGQRIVPAIHIVDVKKKLGDDEKPGIYRLPQFANDVTVKKDVAQATAYVCGLGHFDFFIDGRKVGDHFLDPGWRKYDKEALYVGFDITQQMKQGKHSIRIMLGNGFYNVPRERYFKLLQSFGAPKMRMCIVVRYTDGTTEHIVSDKSWYAAESPITFSSIYGGESYDATHVTKWRKAVEVEQNIRLKAQIGTELKVRQAIPAVNLFKNAKGQWIYDLGQNFSGIVHLKVSGQRGKTVRLVPAELLKTDRSVNQRATGSPYYFEYTLSGDSIEEWQPQFTYYGFRYVQVEGAVPAGEVNPDSLPIINGLVGLHTTSGLHEAGTFECSNPLFNRTYELIDWAMRSNMASVLTDCPHREKLGWMEQYYLMQNSLMYRYDVRNIYAKTLDDMADSQSPSGAMPTIAPEYVRFDGGFEDTPEWGSAFIVSPWYIYKMYGDASLTKRHYAAMQRYMDYLASRADNHIIAYGLGDWFDIGPQKPGKAQLTSNGLTATATYYYDATLMAQMATLTGHYSDAERYASLAEDIKKAYNARFFASDKHTYENGSQTANAISLFMGLVPEGEEQAVLDNLIADIRNRGNALTAGDIGYRYVLKTLERYGCSDVIYDMNSRYDVPGYGWQLAHGATALTESWQAYDNVSNNHFMLGHIMEWFFGGLGGIRQSDESVAFNNIVIDPQVAGDLTSVRTTYESVNGRIACEWKHADDEYTLRMEIPANATATVVMPTGDPDNVTDYGCPAATAEGVKLKAINNGKTEWTVGSGTYLFKTKQVFLP